MMQAPVTVLQANTKRDTGKKAQYGNIMAGKVRRRCPTASTALAATRRRRCRRSNAGAWAAWGSRSAWAPPHSATPLLHDHSPVS